MGTWGTAIKDNDAFADIYGEFFELYNKGGQPENISQKIRTENWEILEIEEEKHSFWFAIALAQWETKSLNAEVLSTVENIIISGADLKLWLELGASEYEIKKRKIALDNFLGRLRSSRPKAKPRKRPKLKTPIFSTGDCLAFKINNGNYGGAVVLATDKNTEDGCNLIATTRLNTKTKPRLIDFENAEVLVCNFGNWQNEAHVMWYMPDEYYKNYSGIYELVGKIEVELEYDINNSSKDYLFRQSLTLSWMMNYAIERQLESEVSKPKPLKTLTIKQFTRNTNG